MAEKKIGNKIGKAISILALIWVFFFVLNTVIRPLFSYVSHKADIGKLDKERDQSLQTFLKAESELLAAVKDCPKQADFSTCFTDNILMNTASTDLAEITLLYPFQKHIESLGYDSEDRFSKMKPYIKKLGSLFGEGILYNFERSEYLLQAQSENEEDSAALISKFKSMEGNEREYLERDLLQIWLDRQETGFTFSKEVMLYLLDRQRPSSNSPLWDEAGAETGRAPREVLSAAYAAIGETDKAGILLSEFEASKINRLRRRLEPVRAGETTLKDFLQTAWDANALPTLGFKGPWIKYSQQPLFDRAEAAFENGDLETAADLYGEVLEAYTSVIPVVVANKNTAPYINDVIVLTHKSGGHRQIRQFAENLKSIRQDRVLDHQYGYSDRNFKKIDARLIWALIDFGEETLAKDIVDTWVLAFESKNRLRHMDKDLDDIFAEARRVDYLVKYGNKTQAEAEKMVAIKMMSNPEVLTAAKALYTAQGAEDKAFYLKCAAASLPVWRSSYESRVKCLSALENINLSAQETAEILQLNLENSVGLYESGQPQMGRETLKKSILLAESCKCSSQAKEIAYFYLFDLVYYELNLKFPKG